MSDPRLLRDTLALGPGMKLYLISTAEGMPVASCLADPKIGGRKIAGGAAPASPTWAATATPVRGCAAGSPTSRNQSHGLPATETHPPCFYVYPEATVSWVGDGEDVPAFCEAFLRAPAQADVPEKLAQSGADERHAVVIVTLDQFGLHTAVDMGLAPTLVRGFLGPDSRTAR